MKGTRLLPILFLLTVLVVPLGCSGETGRLENGSFTASLDGVDIHYEVRGTGPVLMTVPNSWGLSLEGLRAMYRPLEEHLTMVYFDPRGMGSSGPVREESDMSARAVRDDFDALRRHLGLADVHAIGWSNGAMNLLLLAAERPETIRSAIFVHGAASFGPEDQMAMGQKYPELFARYAEFVQRMQSPDLTDEQRTAASRALMLEQWFPLITANPEAAVELLGRTFADAEFSWKHNLYSQTEWPEFDVRDRLADITMPSLVIAGAHDMMPVHKAEQLRDGLPNARLAVFDDSGHFAPVEQPDEFRAVVLEFLGIAEGS